MTIILELFETLRMREYDGLDLAWCTHRHRTWWSL